LEIPVFSGSKTKTEPSPSTEPSSWSPSTVDEPTKWEYEFSNFDGAGGYICILWDTNDVSACERVVHRPLTEADITYSQSGNGFVNDGTLRYTFTKLIYQRSAILPTSKADKILSLI
jgi:hypothetical protein